MSNPSLPIQPQGQPYCNLNFESAYAPIYAAPAQTVSVKQKPEKPLLKTHIPGTDWLRITTTERNIFYFHRISKKSTWVVSDELKAVLDAFEVEEKVDEQTTAGKSKSKRKADEPTPAGKAVKKAKLYEPQVSEEETSDEEEEEWRSKAAEQLAAEAEDFRKLKEEEQKKQELQEAQRAFAASEIVMPRTVDLSVEESKALFKALLREKDINPLYPWDTSLPNFISDPRYVLLPSVTARREAFDEYCKERARELREMGIKKVPEISDPKEGFDRLLKEEVKSTRTNWTDFRKTWKKDRRFYGWGRDDREREKRFRGYLKELGNIKKEAALRAEANFIDLLRGVKSLKLGSSWQEVKRGISSDPRYDAVGSSSMREELFNAYIKQLSGNPHSQSINNESVPTICTQQEDRRVRAIREREEKVQAMRKNLIGEIEQSKIGIDIEEGERSFLTLLTDAVRDPRISWEQALPQLETDPRCTHSPVPLNRQIHLFHSHMAKLHSKQMASLYTIFEANTSSLATRFSELPLQSILSSAPVVRLGFDVEQIKDEFSKWQRNRMANARNAFDEMLAENSFVKFWGRLGKMGENELESYVKVEDDDIGEVDDNKVDMKTLAKNINFGEMEKVLKHDKRFIVFNHIPDQREQWLRDYLSQLSAPKLSVHLPG